jgi:hypothetical protein
MSKLHRERFEQVRSEFQRVHLCQCALLTTDRTC